MVEIIKETAIKKGLIKDLRQLQNMNHKILSM